MAKNVVKYSCEYIHVCDDIGPAHCTLCKHYWKGSNVKRTKFEVREDAQEVIDNIISDDFNVKKTLLQKTLGYYKGEETMNFLYSIEGTDKSGKETQVTHIMELLIRIFKKSLYHQKKLINLNAVSYPKYESDASFCVKEYLAGKFGEDLSKINPMMSSVFYAVDRGYDYHTNIKPFLESSEEGVHNIIISDRYVGSNLVHQGSNLNSRKDIVEFCRDVKHLEYDIMGIPKPSKTFFLDVPPEISFNLRKDEDLKTGGSKDILEGNLDHIKKAYENGKFIAVQEDWIIIPCTKDGQFRPVKEITVDIVRFIIADFISKNSIETEHNESIAGKINDLINMYLKSHTIEELEDIGIEKLIEERESNSNGKKYTLDEAKEILNLK